MEHVQRFSIYYFLKTSYLVTQLITYYLHCISYYKQSRYDVKYAGCVQVIYNYNTLLHGLENP
jgi:hypothetical protein